MVRNKSAQMKIQQMAFMLIAIFLFFALVGLFVFTFQFSNLKKSAELLEEKEAKALVSKLANSPEFSCYNSFGSEKVDCIDLDKIMILKSNIGDYNGFWGIKGIEIRRIYPEGSGIECSSVNYPDCDYIKLVSSEDGIGIANFVTLCRKEVDENFRVYDKCELGKMIITYGV
jgi:hypothetical protein